MKPAFLILFFIPTLSLSQDLNIDSLHKIISQPFDDSNKVKAHCDLSWTYSNVNNNDSALFYANRAFEIAERTHWDLGKEYALVRKAIVMSESGNNIIALEILFSALKIGEKIKNRHLATVYTTIGSIYNRLEDYKEAIFYNKLALSFMNKIGLKIRPGLYSNLADAFLKYNEIDSALQYQNKSYELATLSNDARWLTYSTCNLGNIYSELKQIGIANAYYKSAAAMPYLQNKENEEILSLNSEIYIGLATNYKKLGQYDSSYHFGIYAFDFASKMSSCQSSLKVATFLSEYFRTQKRIDSLSKYQQLIISYKDSIYNSDKIKKVTELKISESYRQTENKAKQKREQEYRRRNIQLALIATFIPIFAACVYLVKKKSKKNNKILLFLGVASLLMLFEFLSLLIHPAIEKITNHNAILMYLSLLVIASILVPLHHRLEKFVKHRL